MMRIGLAAVLAAAAATAVPFPDGFRRFAHVKTTLVGPEANGPAKNAGYHHIYANAAALDGYRGGTFADGSVLVFDVLEAQTQGGVTREGARKFTDVMLRDPQRFAATGGWGFAEFDAAGKQTLDEAAAAACFACHQKRADTGYVFSRLRE